MGDVLRIIDRFKITGHGVIYIVKISKGANVRKGDLLSDLRGNRFEVSGIEMFRRKIPEGKTFEDIPLGLMLKQIDGVDPFGNILVKNLKEINFIFCNHPLKEKLMKTMKMSIKRLGYITLVHYSAMKTWKAVSCHCLEKRYLVLQFIVVG